ncbi:MAG: tetratricopeptide repeat protein [Promethearchaeota archaeon]|nr:MAG: tetratricopeptide repeat protein [Candidatus Lokiarchaeota archaeon]
MASIYTNKDIDLSAEEIKNIISEKLENLKELELVAKGSEYIKELGDIAFLQLEIGEYEDAEKNLRICLKHFKRQLDRLGQAAVYGLLGTLYFKENKFDESNINYSSAYEIYKELNQVQEQITCLKGIGINLIKLNHLDDACDKFLDCSAICSDNNDIYNLLDCIANLIFIHETQEKWDVVFELYKKSLEAFEKTKDVKGIIVSYFNMGILRKKSNKLDEALNYFKQGTNRAIESNYIELILKGLSYVAENLFYMGKLNEAKNEYIKALSLSEKIHNKNSIMQLRVLLQSLGLSENDIQNELKIYNESKKN